jgi:hypothetical protein
MRMNDRWLVDVEDDFLRNKVLMNAPHIHHDVT